MANNTYRQRAKVTPPHVGLRALRHVSKLTLDDVCAKVNETNARLSLTRGALSAIENGLRGASADVLAALEVVYDLEAGSIDTQYQPRVRVA